MSRLNLTWRIALTVAAAMLTGAIVSGMLLFQLSSAESGYNAILGDQQVQHQDRARVMQIEFKKQVQEWKDLLLRGHNDEDRKKYRDSFKKDEASVRELAEKLLVDVSDAEARTRIREFIAAHDAMRNSYDAAIEVFDREAGKNPAAADALVKGIDRSPTAAIDGLVDRLRAVLADAQREQSLRVDDTRRRLLVIIPLVFTAIGVLVALMIRHTRREMSALTVELSAAARETRAAAGQVATSSQSLSQGATEQAASLEETSASMEEMASMTRRNAENAARAATLVASVGRQVSDSNRALGEMVTSMTAIKDSSSEVAKIIKTIDEIAFQTNILALNAAVEAARAGEAGMGFAVVADEVRTLAQRSAQAAKDTAGLIEESISRSQEGAVKVEDVATAIGAITGSVSEVTVIVDEVREASRQQSQGIDQVSQAIAQMEKVTQSTAATAEESAAASEELSGQAETAMGAVRQLESLVGRSSAPGAERSKKRKTAGTPGKVVRLPVAATRIAEDEIPLGDTGTYGAF
jgi:methyl-accepting chemotaxis protein/methyl-accepting chemotaxis protein-1 (serine sensor receptor)